MMLSRARKDAPEYWDVDVLVAGGGIAGLRAALAAADEGCSVLVAQRGSASSQFLHAANAAFLGGPRENRPPALFDDMMLAGGFINRPALVALCCHGSEEQVRYLENIGVPFVKQDGRFVLRQAAGSRTPHSIYTPGTTGELMMARMREQLIAQANIKMLTCASLLQLAKGAGGIAGGFVWDHERQSWLAVRAKAVVLATGGASNLYSFTTQPPVNLGEGLSMALEAGAELVDMEFVCFEPTAVKNPAFGLKVVATTLLKEGGVLRNRLLETFVDTDLPTAKDVVSRAIHGELAAGRGTADGTVLFDLRGVPETILAGYRDIMQGLKNLGLEHRTAVVPVAPAFHYLSGGVRVDGECRTSVLGLFAVGEACGGVHGAHRIAGGAGNDTMVMGAKAGETAAAYARGLTNPHSFEGPVPVAAQLELLRNTSDSEAMALERVRTAMDTGVGIQRDAASLRESLEIIWAAKGEVRKGGQAFRTVLICQAIAGACLRREESRGDHFRSDFPARDDLNWLGNIVTTMDASGTDLVWQFIPVGMASRL